MKTNKGITETLKSLADAINNYADSIAQPDFERGGINFEGRELLDFDLPRRNNYFDPVKEPELKVGQWYKDPKEDDLFCIDNIDCGFFRAYGVVNKKWLEKDNGHKFNTYFFSNRLVPATEEEVVEALTQEAKRRFPIPCKIDYLDNARCKDLEGYALHFENNELSADWKNRQVLFKDGQWAEIISQPEKKHPIQEILDTSMSDIKNIPSTKLLDLQTLISQELLNRLNK